MCFNTCALIPNIFNLWQCNANLSNDNLFYLTYHFLVF